VLGNHDQPRLATRFGGQPQARLAGMLLLTLRGTPTLYYADELGLENGIIPLEKIQDPQGINLGAVRTRDVTRTPMQWNASPQSGFSGVEPWLPVSSDFATRNVANQSQQPDSIFNLYRRLLAIRAQSPSLQAGTFRSLDVESADCFVYIREYNEERHLVALNFSAQACEISIPHISGSAQFVLSTHMDRTGSAHLEQLTLRAYEGIILRVAGAA
jgi:alpha-glucosidase